MESDHALHFCWVGLARRWACVNVSMHAISLVKIITLFACEYMCSTNDYSNDYSLLHVPRPFYFLASAARARLAASRRNCCALTCAIIAHVCRSRLTSMHVASTRSGADHITDTKNPP